MPDSLLQIPDSLQTFLRRLHRGALILRILWLFLMALAVLALILSAFLWAALAFLLVMACVLLGIHVSRRYLVAWKVATNPQWVYWAHATPGFDRSLDAPLSDCSHLTLHLRDGSFLQIDLPPISINELVAWLTEHNPSVRCGRYDDLDPTVETIIPTEGRSAAQAKGSTPDP
jgi:hypothetical protein